MPTSRRTTPVSPEAGLRAQFSAAEPVKLVHGLYTLIADEEKALRREPAGAGSGIGQKIRGALE